MQITTTSPLDHFDELATQILGVLLCWPEGSRPQFRFPEKGVWVFDFDAYRKDGRVASVVELLAAFSERFKQSTIHGLHNLAGFLIMSSERYDLSLIRILDQDPEVKARHIAAVLRHEFGSDSRL